MRILLFNDTHLTHTFDRELYNYIAKLVKSVDQVIINGDFWDGYLTTFDKFCASEWRQLFPLLKEKQTVYILGNHDKKIFMDSRVNLFSDIQVDSHQFRVGSKIFFVSHGHAVAPTYDSASIFQWYPATRFLYQIATFFVRLPFIRILYASIDRRVNMRQLQKIKLFVQKNKHKKRIFIFGHSHIPEYNPKEQLLSIAPLQQEHKGYCIISNSGIEFYSQGTP